MTEDAAGTTLHIPIPTLLAAMPSSDRDHRTETSPISGDPPNPVDPRSGCRFHTPRPFAEPPCARELQSSLH